MPAVQWLKGSPGIDALDIIATRNSAVLHLVRGSARVALLPVPVVVGCDANASPALVAMHYWAGDALPPVPVGVGWNDAASPVHLLGGDVSAGALRVAMVAVTDDNDSRAVPKADMNMDEVASSTDAVPDDTKATATRAVPNAIASNAIASPALPLAADQTTGISTDPASSRIGLTLLVVRGSLTSASTVHVFAMGLTMTGSARRLPTVRASAIVAPMDRHGLILMKTTHVGA
ncbi:MAG TPA: hypothetical protein VHE81_01920 [Lacipirellulaceae bacterium]|nr:hypothetical protein [Lacipirellulaceae bacterium]